MHPRTTLFACGACLVVGGLVGLVLGRGGRAGDGPAEEAATAKHVAPAGTASAWGSRDHDSSEATASPATRRRPSAVDDLRTRRDSDDRDRDRTDPDPAAAPSSPSEPAAPEPAAEAPQAELERLRRELVELREEQREVMGEPVEPPPDLEPRFSGPSMSGAVTTALSQANVPGMVEGTDCSEHPCIVLGRLEGDEEAMEEVERAASLSVYDGDVLTLLFWATSVEEPGAKAAETGLFALAFYSFEDRASRGEELDRRIRARVMEFWNHDRPGQPTP